MLKQIGTQAKDAAAEIAVLSTDKKNQILQTMADELLKNSKKILDANKKAQIEGAYKSEIMKNEKGYRVARLPNIIVHQLAKKGILSYSWKVLDKTAFFRWLNDSDNRHFRIYTGNL